MSAKEKWIFAISIMLGLALMLAVSGIFTRRELASGEAVIAVTGGDQIQVCCAKAHGSMHPALFIAEQKGKQYP